MKTEKQRFEELRKQILSYKEITAKYLQEVDGKIMKLNKILEDDQILFECMMTLAKELTLN